MVAIKESGDNFVAALAGRRERMSPSDMLTLTKTFECSRKAHFHTPAPHIVRTEEQNGVVTVVVTELTEDLQKFLAELKRKNEMQKGERL